MYGEVRYTAVGEDVPASAHTASTRRCVAPPARAVRSVRSVRSVGRGFRWRLLGLQHCVSPARCPARLSSAFLSSSGATLVRTPTSRSKVERAGADRTREYHHTRVEISLPPMNVCASRRRRCPAATRSSTCSLTSASIILLREGQIGRAHHHDRGVLTKVPCHRSRCQ